MAGDISYKLIRGAKSAETPNELKSQVAAAGGGGAAGGRHRK